MKPITVHLDRYKSLHSWANRILRIDLSDMRIWAQETAPYVPAYLGGRGIAARICWDEYPEPVDPFDPANPLMVITGALTGSRAPYSGRTIVCAFSPQASPDPWFTRSSIGGRFGGELKRAGYDGIVVTGAAETPVQVRIRDDKVSILAAEDLWGLDIMDALEALESSEGKGVRALVIGPAGERLSRIATIQTASSSAAGQGGFGAVMGSKRLKAISVSGSGRVSLAAPETITSISRALGKELADKRKQGLGTFGSNDIKEFNQQLAAEGNGSAHCEACTEGCITPCVVNLKGVPGAVHDRKWSGVWFCVSAIMGSGCGESKDESLRRIYDWRLDRRAAFEINVLSNRYGLNQYDLLVGMVPWLIACQKAGLISEMNGQTMDWSSPAFWVEFLRATAYREGLGDVLAEGGWAAAKTLHLGEDLAQTRYAGWGYAGHWDGHFGHSWPFFPYWLVPAVQWMSETRDPVGSGNASLLPARIAGRLGGASNDAERARILDQLRVCGERLYHDPDATDPYGGYRAKGYPAFYHSVRAAMVDCVPVDGLTMPLLWSETAPDHVVRIPGIDGVGDIEGPSVEYHLFQAGTGTAWSEEEFDRAAERVCTLDRALQVRHWARDRSTDEMILPYFERPEVGQNPLLERRHGLDRAQFSPVIDEFYTLNGWDVERGWPTAKRLRELGMAELYEPMVEGAAKAREKHPAL